MELRRGCRPIHPGPWEGMRTEHRQQAETAAEALRVGAFSGCQGCQERLGMGAFRRCRSDARGWCLVIEKGRG